MVTPNGKARIVLENTNSVGHLPRPSISTVQSNVFINRVSGAIAAFKFSGHIAQAVLTHVKVGAIEPVRVGIVIWYKHLRHGNFIGNRSKGIWRQMAHSIEYRSLARIKAQIKLPAVPIKAVSADRKVQTLCAGNRQRAK